MTRGPLRYLGSEMARVRWDTGDSKVDVHVSVEHGWNGQRWQLGPDTNPTPRKGYLRL